MGAIDIKCRNFNKDIGIYIKDKTIEEISNRFVLNKILHNVVMSWIIFSNNKIIYETKETIHPHCLNKGLVITQISVLNNMEKFLKIL